MTASQRHAAGLFAALAIAALPSLGHAADAAPAVAPTSPPLTAPPPAALPPAPAQPAPAAAPAPAAQPTPAASPNQPEPRAAPAAEPVSLSEEAPPAAPEEAPVSAFGRKRRQLVALPPRPTQPPPDEVRADDGLMGSHQTHFYGMLGYRATRVTSDGYQPFAKDQAFHQLSVLLGRVLFTDEALSVALGAGWDFGASDANARGSDTSLEVHRLSLVPELRYHFARRLYAFGRVGAGASFVHAELADAVTAGERTSSRVAFSVDPNVGVAFEAIGEAAGSSRQPRVWLLLDGGYLFTTETQTVLANESGAPARSDEHAFADLGLSGVSGRLSAALTF